MRTSRTIKNQSGFGLVEAMVSIFVMGVASVSFVAAYLYCVNLYTDAKIKVKAAELLNNGIEVFRFRGTFYSYYYDVGGNEITDWDSITDDNGNLLPGVFQVSQDFNESTWIYNSNLQNQKLGTKYNYSVYWVGRSGELKSLSYEVVQ